MLAVSARFARLGNRSISDFSRRCRVLGVDTFPRGFLKANTNAWRIYNPFSEADLPILATKVVRYHAYDVNATTSTASLGAAIEADDEFGRSLV